MTNSTARRLTIAAGIIACAGVPSLAADPALAASGADVPRFLGRLHPMVVHFPIALLLAAVLFEVWAIVIRRERSKPSPAAVACVLLGTLGAGAAAWFGWMNADIEPHGRGVANLIEVHRWLGIATVSLAAVALVAALVGLAGRTRGMTAVYRVALVLAAGVVGVTGHWGGTIVYGEGYLTEALFPREAAPIPDVETQLAQLGTPASALTVDFATQVAPIFADRCVKCHGPQKKKGNLRLDARHFVFDERADEPVIIPGDAQSSELIFRVSLPADDEDVMPPEGKAEPLTAQEVAILTTWINEGAVWSDVPIVAVGAVATDEPAEESPVEFVFDEAARHTQQLAIDRLRERGAVATRVSAQDPWVDVRFDLLGKQVSDQDLSLLEGLEPTLWSLNLAGTGVTDAGLETLAPFTRIERLHLDRTEIGDAGVEHLAPLKRITYLNLYGTNVSDRGLVAIARLPALTRLYLWQTEVSPQAGALLAALKPGLEVEVASSLTPASFDEPQSAPEPAPAQAAAETEAPAEPGAIDVALLPGCCRAAVEKGGECDHPCCVAARLAGQICETCSN